jgi:hypothetical protein
LDLLSKRRVFLVSYSREENYDVEAKEDFNQCYPNIHVLARLLLLDDWKQAVKKLIVPQNFCS